MEKILRRGRLATDITPHLAARLGAAFADVYNDKKIGIGCDFSPSSVSLANAFTAGAAFNGASVISFGKQTIPVTRSCIDAYNLTTAAHFSFLDNTSNITFMNSIGAALSKNEEDLINSSFGKDEAICDPSFAKAVVAVIDSKQQYTQGILSSLKSPSFSVNMMLRTRSEAVSDILKLLFGSSKIRLNPNASSEFSAEIDQNGEKLTIMTDSNTPISENKYWAIISILCAKHFGLDKILLPISVSDKIESLASQMGLTIIFGEISGENHLQAMLKNGLKLQARLCFDAIFLAITLLDFINANNISFLQLLSSIPDTHIASNVVNIAESDPTQLTKTIENNLIGGKLSFGNGIKVYRSNGWVLVMPEKYKHTITVITESTSTEAAYDLCADITNQIKTLQKI